MPILRIRPLCLVLLNATLLVAGCGDVGDQPPSTASETTGTTATTTAAMPAAPAASPAQPGGDVQPVDTAPVPGHAVLAFDDPLVDFGSLADFEKRQATVTFRNAGGAALRISKVEPTCGCTSVGFDTSRTYAPGQGGEITLAFSPKGQGRQTKLVRVVSNDPDEPVRTITIKADIQPSLSAEPRVLKLGRIPLGEPFETGTTLTALRPGITLDDVTLSGGLGPYATASLQPTGTDAQGRETWRVDVALDDRVPWGWHTGSMVVSGIANTEDGRSPVSMNFAINGSAEGEIRADDSMLRLMVVRPGGSVEKSIDLSRADGRPFRCEAVGVTGDRTGGFAAVATPLDPDGRAWRVTLSGAAPIQAGSITGSVLLTTDVPGEESLSIRIGGVVRRQ